MKMEKYAKFEREIAVEAMKSLIISSGKSSLKIENVDEIIEMSFFYAETMMEYFAEKDLLYTC
jgi:hypothetical protein